MFEISFAEMMVVAVVALLVIGPEKLPKVARTLGHLLGRAQRYVNGVKNDIARDMNMEELNRLQDQIKKEFDQAQATLNQTTVSVDEQVRQINQAVANTVENIAQPEVITPEAITLHTVAPEITAPETIPVAALQVADAPVVELSKDTEAAPANKASRQVAAPKRTLTPPTPPAETPPTTAVPVQKSLTLD